MAGKIGTKLLRSVPFITTWNVAWRRGFEKSGLQEGVLFYQKPADPKFNLTLTPTCLYFKMRVVIKDYQLEEWITMAVAFGKTEQTNHLRSSQDSNHWYGGSIHYIENQSIHRSTWRLGFYRSFFSPCLLKSEVAISLPLGHDKSNTTSLFSGYLLRLARAV